jgi:hypothetical protein
LDNRERVTDNRKKAEKHHRKQIIDNRLKSSRAKKLNRLKDEKQLREQEIRE